MIMEVVKGRCFQLIAGGNGVGSDQKPLFTPEDPSSKITAAISNGGGGANGAFANLQVTYPITDNVTIGGSATVVTNYSDYTNVPNIGAFIVINH